MRILFTTWAWASHYFPMVPTAWALQAAGHDVRVAAPPSLTGVIAQSGLTAVATGEDVDFVEIIKRAMSAGAAEHGAAPDGRELRRSRGAQSLGMFVAVAEAMADDVVAFAEEWQPDLIVYDATTYAGPLAAARIGRPGVRHLLGPDMMWQGRQFEPEVLRPLLERFGLDSLDTIGALTLDPCPPSLQIPTTTKRQPMRYVPYNGSAELPRWLRETPERPRVCLTSGTGIPRFDQQRQFVPRMSEVLTGLGLEVVAAVSPRHRDLLGPLPSGVRLVQSLPLRLVLPTCAAVVHHGGAGTALTALLHGLPQLVVPQLPNEVFLGERLVGAGVAAQLMSEELEEGRVTAELERLLNDPRPRRAAQEVREEILAQPTPLDVARVLEDLA